LAKPTFSLSDSGDDARSRAIFRFLQPLSHRLMGRSPKTRTPGAKAGCLKLSQHEYNTNVPQGQGIFFWVELCRLNLVRIRASALQVAEKSPSARQVSGHDFSRVVKPKKNLGFSPCHKKPQGLKARVLLPCTARVNSCPDTCLVHGRTSLFTQSCRSSLAFLRVSAPPRWIFCSGKVLP
jgi:hypothetical protein